MRNFTLVLGASSIIASGMISKDSLINGPLVLLSALALGSCGWQKPLNSVDSEGNSLDKVSQQAPDVRTVETAKRKVAEATVRKMIPKKPKEVASVSQQIITEPGGGNELNVKAGRLTSIDLTTLFPMHQTGQVMMVDARTPIFYTLGHIDGAVSLPLKQRAVKIPALMDQFKSAQADGKAIVVYCANLKCPDALSLAKILVLNGLDVSVYEEGWQEWKSAGL